LHLAQYDRDRRRLIADPTLWPSTVEELLRLYAIVANDGRKLTQDLDSTGTRCAQATW
jgi:cytochrome P450